MQHKNAAIAQQPSPLPDINEVLPLSEDDRICRDEIRKILAKHGKLGRFGICLLHSHFPISDDEILTETVDVANRILTIQPAKKHDVSTRRTIETMWRLDNGATLLCCHQHGSRP